MTTSPNRRRSARTAGRGPLQRALDHRILTHAEEVELGRRIQAGRRAAEELRTAATPAVTRRLRVLVRDGEIARDTLVDHNYRFAMKLVLRKERGNRLVDVDDLFQECWRPLRDAADGFDPDSGNRFITYVATALERRMTRATVEGEFAVRLPERVQHGIWKVARARNDLEFETGAAPSDEAVAARAKCTVEQVAEWDRLVATVRSVSSADAGIETDDSTILRILPDPDADPEAEVLGELEVQDLMSLVETVLDPRQRFVVELRFGLDGAGVRSLAEVAAELGISRERVRQIEVAALARLRHPAHELVGMVA